MEQELETANINTDISLNFIFGYRNLFFETFYWLPNHNVSYDLFYIRTGVVKSEFRQQAQQKMQQETIPQFIDWATKILSLPPNSTKLSKELYFVSRFEHSC